MILYNPEPHDTETDNHWLPAVHLGRRHRAPGLPGRPPGRHGARSPPGVKAHGHGRRDGGVLLARPGRARSSSPTSPRPACRSSPATRRCRTTSRRRPAGPVLPGHRRHLDVVAAHRRLGDPAEGAAPDWTPGQIKSALMTTANTAVRQGGRDDTGRPVRLRRRPGRPQRRPANPGLTFDEIGRADCARWRRPGPRDRPEPASVNSPVMPGEVSTVRTVQNVTEQEPVLPGLGHLARATARSPSRHGSSASLRGGRSRCGSRSPRRPTAVSSSVRSGSTRREPGCRRSTCPSGSSRSRAG